MILAEQWGKRHTSEHIQHRASFSFSFPLVQEISKRTHRVYSKLRRMGRKISYEINNGDHKPKILEFNAYALVKRYQEFRKVHENPDEALSLYLETVRSDIKTWVNEFLKKAQIDTFTITLDPKTGKMTNHAYEQFDDDLIQMMETNEKHLHTQGKDTSRAHADTLSMKRVRDWALSAPVGSSNLSISPRYTEASEQLIDDPYEFVFFRTITERTSDVITIETHQYKTWLTYKAMEEILCFSGFVPNDNWRCSPEDIAAIAKTVDGAFTEDDLILLLNSLTRTPKNQERELSQFIKDQEEFEQSLKIAEDFLVEIVTKMLSTLNLDQSRLLPSHISKIIEEAINFSMRYMIASREQNLVGKKHDIDYQTLLSTFSEYIDVKYFGKKVTKEEAAHVMENVSVSLGGFLGKMASATQCYGSFFDSLSLSGSIFTAPNYSFAGLGNIRPEHAQLLKEPMNCPHCKKKVLVWKHEKKVQCSWCGRYKECGADEKLGETYQELPHKKEKPTHNVIHTKIPNYETQTSIKNENKINAGLWLFSFFAPKYVLKT